MALALPFLTVGRLAYAQGIITGGISGTVTDPTGAIIPGASVKVVGESTGTTFQVTSNGEGAFLVADVPLGLYTITVTAKGFGPASTSHVRMVAGNASKAFPATPVPGTTSTVLVTDGTTVANVEVAQFERTFPTAIFDQEHLGRIDYQLSDKDRFYLRYNYQNYPYNHGFTWSAPPQPWQMAIRTSTPSATK